MHSFISFSSHYAGRNAWGVEVRTGDDATHAGLRPVAGAYARPKNGDYAVIERVSATGAAMSPAFVGDGTRETARALVDAAGNRPLSPSEFDSLCRSRPGLFTNSH